MDLKKKKQNYETMQKALQEKEERIQQLKIQEKIENEKYR